MCIKILWGSFFFFFLNFIYLFIYGSAGSSVLCEGSLQLWQAGATLHRGVRASLVVEHRPETHRLSNCGSRAQPLRGMRDPPRPGPEPASPALAGRLPTTAPPGKPWGSFLKSLSSPRIRISQRECQMFAFSKCMLLPPPPSVKIYCSIILWSREHEGRNHVCFCSHYINST